MEMKQQKINAKGYRSHEKSMFFHTHKKYMGEASDFNI
jgi:hypothetical protein